MNPLHSERRRQHRLRKGAAQLGHFQDDDANSVAAKSPGASLEIDWSRPEADPASGDTISSLALTMAAGR